ncbi:MAG: hypothetical protein HY794_13520 [Desulfarculus sp.]|nr:hypothetical protein [Desulfarculus sp.]
MEDIQKPSIGRVVIYNHPGSADGKYPPMKSPAIVQRVCLQNPNDTENEFTVDLFVMSNTGGIFFAKGIAYGEGPSQWNWPPRV